MHSRQITLLTCFKDIENLIHGASGVRGGEFVVGTASQLIVGMQVGRDLTSDARCLAPLRAQAQVWGWCA